MKKEYNTEQKCAIINFLKENSDRHFTVEEISNTVCKNGAGKSTVYRHVSRLLEAGVIRRFETPENRKFVYQFANTHEHCDSHFHMKCIKCGRLLHVECAKLDDVCEHIRIEHDFIIGFGRSVLYGECCDCAGC